MTELRNTGDTDSAASMTTSGGNNLSIMELPGVLASLFDRVQCALLPGAQGRVGLFVRYLRRKPERGLAVIYTVDELRSTRKSRSNDPHRSVSLTLGEQALDGARILFNALQARQAAVVIQPSGVLYTPDLGLSVQTFPADDSLPALATSCDTTSGGPVFEALQAAARVQLQDASWQLVSAQAQPVRYKPANRCVIRYHLTLKRSAEDALRELTIFGKVYAHPAQARSVQMLQQQLYTEQVRTGGEPFLPQPLGLIESLGLTFNEAVQPARSPEAAETPDEHSENWGKLLTGTRVFQSRIVRGRGGAVAQVVIPEEALRLTAQALARLHTSSVRPGKEALRTGAKEAKRARERAALIAGRNPGQVQEVQQLAQQLAQHLEALRPDEYRPAHGGFKSSQLLFHSRRVFVVDFDGFCLADPALDVGYFLAYLRPSALWYHRPGMREWFTGAAEVFRREYAQAMITYQVSQETVNGVLERSQLYEAALLFKIATRRVNRLNSPRPQELAAMLEEIAGLLRITP